MAEARKSHFAPLVSPRTRVLILGSLPGEASLKAQRYYAHPANQFWRLVGAVIDRDLHATAYEVRLAALGEAGIGLWDTIASATRQGSLDGAIRDAEHAALGDLVAMLPALRAIAFNGAKSAKVGRSQFTGTPLALIDLPSSSPAYAAMRLADKTARWLVLREYLR